MLKFEQLKLPLEIHTQSLSRGNSAVVVHIEQAQMPSHTSHSQRIGTSPQTPHTERRVSLPTPTVDCRCNLYERGKEWCKWFESGDCREA